MYITIKKLNRIINTSINHGGDLGGPYYCQKEIFEEELKDVCKKNHLVIENDAYGQFIRLKKKGKR